MKRNFILYLIIIMAIVSLDILTKRWAVNVLMQIQEMPLIKNVFHLTYVENRGAAFGILQNSRWVFITTSIIVVIAVIYLWIKYNPSNLLIKIGIASLLGGAVGNLIDRIRFGYVVDMFNVKLINFPVFNVADIFVCIGGGLVFLYYAFIHKEDQ